MADTYEQNLGQKTTLTVSDYIRVVGSDNASYKQLVSDVAKKIIENYTGSSLAGSSQSVKSALDSLNSKTGNYVSDISSDYGTVSSNSTIRIGNVVLVSLRLTLTSNAAAYSQIIKGIPTSDTTDVGTIFSIKGKKISGSAISGDVGLSLYRNSSTLSSWIALSNGDVVDISGCYLAKE